eukprot:scaffold93772_cov33-Phaeocystis_antarctica.AAC.1
MGWQKRQLRSPALEERTEGRPSATEGKGCPAAAEGRGERSPTLAGGRSSVPLSTSCGTARAARTTRAPAAAAPAAPV